VIEDQAIINVLRHPLRREILKRVVERDRPLSPVLIARDLEKSLNNISYHVRVLRFAGALVLVDEQPARGSMEHFYVHEKAMTELPWVREALGLPPG
jgi:hypothetical protein